MKKDRVSDKSYVLSILKIILATNIPALAFIFHRFPSSIGWMAGSFASAVNFLIMAFHIINMNTTVERVGANKASKSYIFRYLFLIVWSLFIMIVVKAEIISYCISLLSAQFAIILHHLYTAFRQSKYHAHQGD